MPCYTFVYKRRSSEEDDRQALSLSAQDRACGAYAESRGIAVNELIEESHTARKPGRPLFNSMVAKAEALCKAGTEVRILCHKPDRLVRNIPDWAKLNELWELGVQLEFVDGTFPNNAQGKMTLGMNIVFAKYYVDNLSEEVKKGLREKLDRGEWPGWAPTGYLNAEKQVIPHPVLAPLALRAYTLCATGEYSLERLRSQLASEGLVGRLRGKPLTKSSLYRLLTNPFYCGLFRYNGQMYQGKHEAIVSVELFERVQDVLHGRTRPRRQIHDWRYSGLLHCGNCGCAVVAEIQKGRYIYYHCSHRRGNCSEQPLRQEAMEALLVDEVARAIALPEPIQADLRAAAEKLAREAESGITQEQPALQHRLRDLEARSAGLLDLRITGLIQDDEFTAKRNEIVLEQQRVKERLNAFELPTMNPRQAVEGFIRTCNDVPNVIREGKNPQVRGLLRIIGLNYRLGGGSIDFEPVEPFDLAARVRNRPTWRAGTTEVTNLVKLIEQCSEGLNGLELPLTGG